MAAGDFTESTSQIILENLDQVFPQPTANEAEFNHDIMTAKVLMERQTAVAEDLKEGNRCVGKKAWFIQDGQTSVTYSGTAARTGEDCTTPTGVELQTNSKTYDNNLYIETSRLVNAEKCDNEITFAMESAKAISKAMLDIRKELNKRFIELLTANTQANQYDNVDDNIVTDTGNRLKLDPSLWSFETLAEFRLLANNNKIFDPIYLNGRNLFIDKDLAMYRKLNSDQKDQDAVFNDFDIHWDTKNPGYSIDSVLGRLSTFIVNPNQIFFWNTTHNTMVPQLVDPANNRWVYVMADPELRYNDNGVMRPVLYEVEYAKVCTERTRGRLVWNHTWFVRLYGGLDVGPTGLDDTGAEVYTGIMEIVASV